MLAQDRRCIVRIQQQGSLSRKEARRKFATSFTHLLAGRAANCSDRGQRIFEPCGAVYVHKTWRRGRRMAGELLETASFAVCPACKEQKTSGLCYGKVLISGAYANGDAIVRRIENVAKRAAYTQPERRIVSRGWEGKTLEVLTTSQKLAHRIARELKKAFGGRSTYAWSDRDGTLSATWRKEGAG